MKNKAILKKEKKPKRQSRNKKGKISVKLKSGDNSSSDESDIYFYNDLQRWKNNIKVPIWLKKPKDRESLSEYYKNIIRKLLRVKNKIRAYKIQEAYLIDCLHKCMKYLKLNSLSMNFLDYEIYKNLIYNDIAENLYDNLNYFYEHNNIEHAKNGYEKLCKENLNDCKKTLNLDIKKDLYTDINNTTSSDQIIFQNNDNPNNYEADKNGTINMNRDYSNYKIDRNTKGVKNICNKKTDTFTMPANDLLQNEGCEDKASGEQHTKTDPNEALNLIDLINALNNELLKKDKEKKNNDKHDLMKKAFKKVIIPGSFFENNNFCPIFMNLLKLDIYNACSKNGINMSQKLASLFKAITNFYEPSSELGIETEKQIQKETPHNDVNKNAEKIETVAPEIETSKKSEAHTTNSYSKDLNFFKNQNSLYKLSQYCIEKEVVVDEMINTFDTIYIYNEKDDINKSGQKENSNSSSDTKHILNKKVVPNKNLELTLNVSKKKIDTVHYIESRNSLLSNEECTKLKNNTEHVNNDDMDKEKWDEKNKQQIKYQVKEKNIYNTLQEQNISDKEVYEISSSFGETEEVTIKENKMCNMINEDDKYGQNDNINEYKDTQDVLRCEKNICIYNEKMQDNEYDQVHINKRKLEQTYLFKDQYNDNNNGHIQAMEEEQCYKKKNKIENNNLIKFDVLKNDFFKNFEEYNNIVTPSIHYEKINEKKDNMIPYNIDTPSILSFNKNKENDKMYLKKTDHLSNHENVCNISFHDVESKSFLSCNEENMSETIPNKTNSIEMDGKNENNKSSNTPSPNSHSNNNKVGCDSIKGKDENFRKIKEPDSVLSSISYKENTEINENNFYDKENSDIIILDDYDEARIGNTNIEHNNDKNKKNNLRNKENDKISQKHVTLNNIKNYNIHQESKINECDLNAWFDNTTHECHTYYNEEEKKRKNRRNSKQTNLLNMSNIPNKENENEVSILNINLDKAHDSVLEGLMNFFGLKSKRLPRKILISELKKIQTYLCDEYNKYSKENNLAPTDPICTGRNYDHTCNGLNGFSKGDDTIFSTNFERELDKHTYTIIEDDNVKIESYIKLDELINSDKNKLQEEYINNMKNKIKLMEMEEMHERIDEAINVNESINNIIQEQKKIKYSVLKKYLVDCKLNATKDTIVSYCKNRNIEIIFKRASGINPT
ncbi:conserved Plasmodium protein, unknown function [Plasmodium vinckei vinckei]|uniref:Uncharacterized protein n=1 Tax=Plasmodium vinckei vinckei TaxID=54757 RepID=A0A449C0J3_PLAVN|nr:conserved Plasmodium protein, unknown function [Plasmodium vinckei vinckei]KEG04030.1 hypothetical protein YYE_00932 [Plasmodium vinckei vinckei]VEV59172.1 conserved Plasmodium protein, unknown function [Plasmodium vinckei vinckei]